MKGTAFSLYEKHHIIKNYERLGLFQRLNEKYKIKSVLYPGSYAHITPVFVFPKVIFNDVYKKLQKFYESEEIEDYINKRKFYSEKAMYSYVCADYNNTLPFNKEEFDLLISQYSGFIFRACKQYLKIGGILIANNSHGDASMASINPDYKFTAIINKRKNNFNFSNQNLNKYFIPKRDIEVTEEFLEKRQRGVGYTKSATNYIFTRIK